MSDIGAYRDEAVGVHIYGSGGGYIGTIRCRKAWIGWWIDGRWCPTRAIRDHEIERIKRALRSCPP